MQRKLVSRKCEIIQNVTAIHCRLCSKNFALDIVKSRFSELNNTETEHELRDNELSKLRRDWHLLQNQNFTVTSIP